ncbi:lysozyme [Thiolapillus sp.]
MKSRSRQRFLKQKSFRYISFVVLSIGLVAGCEETGNNKYPKVDKLTAGIFLEPEERAVLPPGVELRPVFSKGLALTKRSEGFRSGLYNDAANYCTIAYGHLLKLAPCDGSEPPEFLAGVTEEQGTELLVDDMERAQVSVMTSVEVDLTDGQYAALCDFVYNVGSGNFRRSTLLKVLNGSQFEQVPFQLLRWVKAGGKELPGLKKRREQEIVLFFDGQPIPRALPEEQFETIDIRKGEILQGNTITK